MSFTGLRDDWRAGASPPDGSIGVFTPERWVLHWGGGGPYRVSDHGQVITLLRGWHAYHTRLVTGADGKKRPNMQDIAYNYAAPPADGHSLYSMRLRGENPNGAHSRSSDPPFYLGRTTRTYVFYTGTRGPDRPSDNQLRAFTMLWQQNPLPVTMHRRLPWQATACAGTFLGEWIDREGWKDYMRQPIKPSDRFIDWVFDSGMAAGDRDYWKQLPRGHREWKDFNAMVRRGPIGWYFHMGHAQGDPEYWLTLDPASHEWDNFWAAVGNTTPQIVT